MIFLLDSLCIKTIKSYWNIQQRNLKVSIDVTFRKLFVDSKLNLTN